MKYRVRVDVAFDDRDTALAAANAIRGVAAKSAATFKAGKEALDTTFISVEECYHDESPTKPCVPLLVCKLAVDGSLAEVK